MQPIWPAAIPSFSEGVGLIQGRAAMAQFRALRALVMNHGTPAALPELGPKKPKNHRQGIAGGFGDLHQSARVSLKT